MYAEVSAVAYKVSSRDLFKAEIAPRLQIKLFTSSRRNWHFWEKQKSVEVRKRVSLILDMQLVKCQIRPFNAPTQDAAVTVKPFFGKQGGLGQTL